MFYMNHTLINSTDSSSFFAEKVPKMNEIVKRLEKTTSSLGLRLQNKTRIPKNLEIRVIKNSDCNSAFIALIIHTEVSGAKHEHEYFLASCTLSEVNYNCGAVHLANLYTGESYGSDIIWDFYKLIEDWCIYANYTFIHGNVAGRQLTLIPKFENLGYKKMGKPYKNVRSGNINVWMYKLIQEGADTDKPSSDED